MSSAGSTAAAEAAPGVAHQKSPAEFLKSVMGRCVMGLLRFLRCQSVCAIWFFCEMLTTVNNDKKLDSKYCNL